VNADSMREHWLNVEDEQEEDNVHESWKQDGGEDE